VAKLSLAWSGPRGEGVARNWRNNPMQSKSPMHLSRRSVTGGKDLTLYEVDEAATRICEEVDVDAGAWPNALVANR
jgi:cell division GTPase FtsZ